MRSSIGETNPSCEGSMAMLTAGQHDIQCLQVCGPIFSAQGPSASEIPKLSRWEAVKTETTSDKQMRPQTSPAATT
jgi:hypothetical protein